ncbi:MAG TPA: phenylalanine--tRNA ligase subunit beta [Ignavibacteriaceae bacterium]|nr:phenylalanine--tRNA ligase subunit beta [Ignavibacteriaceae bacterium]
MKLSLNWLKELVDLSNVSASEIVHQLTMSGLEVEEVIDQNSLYNNFVIGLVKEKKKHPNADKLSLCTVSTGEKEYQVICGAPNVDEGQKVVFAQIGAVVPKGKFKIAKAKIRGIESNGMICSEAELQFSDNHDGIMVLDPGLKEGTPVSDALHLNDVILEIAITPNRPDALSHIGVARDLAAIFKSEVNLPEIDFEETEEKASDAAEIEIIDAENCPRYSSRIVRGVTIQDSPAWLKRRLKNIGLRPINNIVDVSNYIMYETGQPLHAFDLQNLSGHKIVVRSTEKETTFTTLDSKKRKLPSGTLMICDGTKPVAIAGVMGGENSEVTSDTKNILIESAYFNPSSVRYASKILGLSTDASYRFERGTDPNGTIFAAERAAQLISQLAGGEVLKGVLDVYPEQIERKELRLRFERVEKILGYSIEKDVISDIMVKLGMRILVKSNEELHISVPSFRPDIEREIDLIEEIARIHGYDNIPTVAKISITLGEKKDESDFTNKVKETAVELGFYEMINNPLQSEKTASLTGQPIKILNPQSSDMAYLRTSLLTGALQTVSSNINVGEKNLQFFEVGNIFQLKTEKEIAGFEDFNENESLIFVITGKSRRKSWYSQEETEDLYDLKGFIKSFISKFSLDNALDYSYNHERNPYYNVSFTLKSANSEIGSGGSVDNKLLKLFDIDQEVYCFEINLDKLNKLPEADRRYEVLLRFPKVLRDFAFIFDKSVTYKQVSDFILEQSSGLLKSVNLFDLFESDTLGENKKSMAFTLEFFDRERTLTDEEVEKEFLHLISAVAKKFNAKLRGN